MRSFFGGTSKGIPLILITTITVTTIFFLLVRPLGRAELNPGLGNNNFENCSSGWYTTGYFTPVEGDYKSLDKKVIYVQGIGNMSYNSRFLSDVVTEGWGKTGLGWYIGYYNNEWHRSSSPLSANGQPLAIGMVATDPKVIHLDSSLSIRALPRPWNSTTYIATDTSPSIVGKHIDVYTGEGKTAEIKTFEITGPGRIVCVMSKMNSSASNVHSRPCNCVVFRMDDIQDFGFQAGQLAVMNTFLSKNLKLTTAIIMYDFGNDTKVIDKVKEGYQKGLFELALHGWKHVDYTKLSLADQRSSLLMANIKMYKIFGNTSDMFFPPGGTFNIETIDAMRRLGLQIISADLPDEYNFDHSRSNFVSRLIGSNQESNNTVYHMSAMALYKSIDGTSKQLVKHPIEKILADVVQLVQKYGYAGIILHPQDFLKMNADGNFTNIVDENEIRDLSRLIDYITSQNIPIKSFHEVLGQTNHMHLNSESVQDTLHHINMTVAGLNDSKGSSNYMKYQ